MNTQAYLYGTSYRQKSSETLMPEKIEMVFEFFFANIADPVQQIVAVIKTLLTNACTCT